MKKFFNFTLIVCFLATFSGYLSASPVRHNIFGDSDPDWSKKKTQQPTAKRKAAVKGNEQPAPNSQPQPKKKAGTGKKSADKQPKLPDKPAEGNA